MLAHRDESGEDFDLKIATRDLQRATKALVDRSPASEHALILNLGDFFTLIIQATGLQEVAMPWMLMVDGLKY